MRGLLQGIQVLETADGIAAGYCGKLLADLGADVSKREQPGGDSTRRMAHGGMWLYLNAEKRQEAPENAPDVVIDDGTGEVSENTVRVSIRPFGLWGPRASWHGSDLIAFHSSGFAHGFPASQVDSPDLPPLNAPGYAAHFLVGQVAACAALHGLLERQRTGHGSHLDVSEQEAIAAENHSQFNVFKRLGASKRVFSDVPSNATVALLPCADGWIAISPREEHQWARWLEVMDCPAWASDPRFAERGAREANWPALYALLADWTRTRAKHDLFEAAQAKRVACYPLGTASDLLESPQLAAREFFTTKGEAILPRQPYRLELADGPAQPEPPRTRALPLEGVRVVDFSWVMTGPICTRYLAALGAEVIKIESAARPDLSPRDLSWQELNLGKRSITLNLKHERARELVRQLIAQSDVVVENFSSGVMERLGLDYPRLVKHNKRLIMASSSALGRTGPERDRVAYGTLIQCFTGWAALSAHPGHPPQSAAGIWTDPLTAVFELLLVLAAIWRQRTTGLGCYFDLSMAETTIAALPEPLLAWCLEGQELQPRGNRDPLHAPQGCYPALGDDRWVALSVRSDAQWSALCELMERRHLLARDRQHDHDEIDAAIAAWTRCSPPDELAARLQARGIPATPTFEPADVITDPHLVARGFVENVERLDGTLKPSLGVPWLLDRQRPAVRTPPPRLGQDNQAVFGALLGLDQSDIATLIRDQVIY